MICFWFSRAAEPNVEEPNLDETFATEPSDEEDEDRTELGTLPEWANEENANRHKKLQMLEREKEQLDASLLENKESIRVVSAHFKRVEEEVAKTQQLNNVKQKHIPNHVSSTLELSLSPVHL